MFLYMAPTIASCNVSEYYCIILFSREVYHTKRMQHVMCVKWSADSKYILCGSDEMNIRLWKANASEKLGVVSDGIPAKFLLTQMCMCICG